MDRFPDDSARATPPAPGPSAWRRGREATLRAWRIPGREQILAIRALGWLALAHILLRLMPFGRLRMAVAALQRSGSAAPPTTAECAAAIARAATLLPWTSCLARAMAAECLLRRAGKPAELKFAVAVDEARSVDAHAWLESEGSIVVGDPRRLQRSSERKMLE